MASDLFVNLLASLIFLGLGFLSSMLHRSIRNRPFRKLFGMFSDRRCTVLLSTREGPNPESTLRISLSEMHAYCSLQHVLDAIKIETVSESSMKKISEINSDNIFVLGGQFANRLSKEFWSKIYDDLPITINPSSRSVVVGSKTYTPTFDQSSSKMRSYSVILRINNQFKNQGYIFASIGMNGFGTFGGVRALCDKACVKSINKMSGRTNFVGVVESNFEHKVLVNYQLVEFYTLNQL